MDNILEFFQSDIFLYVFPIILGILASWYISKHFAFKKPSILQIAKRSKVTDFGNNHAINQKNNVTSIEHKLFGSWQIQSNGIVTDTKNKLSWIQAPWGTQWNGEQFVGEPLTISWQDASQLFGKSDYVGIYSKIKPLELVNHIKQSNFTKGSCKVTFAGKEDWRLPTVHELATLLFHVPRNEDYEIEKAQKQEAIHIKQQLFPALEVSPDKYTVWSANTASVGCAWVYNKLQSFDDLKTHQKYPVLFVRNS